MLCFVIAHCGYHLMPLFASVTDLTATPTRSVGGGMA